MTSLPLPECARYTPPPPTKEELEFADLAIIDLSKAHTPEGRQELYPQLRDALRTHGFFYAINHGYTQAQCDRIFDIADVPFTVVPPDEMTTYTATIDEGGYSSGYKLRQFWKVDMENNILDQIEMYKMGRNIPHPQALRPFLPEIEAFAQHNHFNVLYPILRLIALSLELPEETLVENHNFDGNGDTSVKFMKYYRRSKEEEGKAKNVWLRGHTDSSSITVLWSQPVGGLQILAPDGRWKWVRHIDNALIINTGDMLNFLTGGYYKPTIHRVFQPPEDQRNYDRLGIAYFTMPDGNVRLLPLVDSPVLQRLGIERQCPDENAPLAETWRKGRTLIYGKTDVLTKGKEHNVDEEVLEGIVVKHYN